MERTFPLSQATGQPGLDVMRRVLLVNDTRLVGHHGSSAVVDVILHEFAERGVAVETDLQLGLAVDAIEPGPWSAVIINGEGAMHSGQRYSHAFSRLGERMQKQSVPVFLINTVFAEDAPEIIARMKSFTAVYCREAGSADRLRATGAVSKLCPDLTFALRLPADLKWQPGKCIVMLDTTVSGKNRVLHKFSIDHGITFQPIRASPRLIRAASSRNILRILRFNMTKSLGKLLRRTYAFNRYANAVTDRLAFLRGLADGTCVVVASRFHGVCFCLKLGVPFLAIASNTPKIEGLLTDADLTDRLLDIGDLNMDAIRARSHWTTLHEERRQRYVSAAQSTIARMFDDISKAVR